ncbi:hypothetical protein, partial [Dehalobacterium formicoaceticum]|uniref:hypothetical protein n=1 Tax=Dehalobacterium formicoaceticum TaxID=51515 RepID=UPI0031F6A495
LNMDYKFANEEILQNWEPVPRIAILQLEIMLSGGSNTIIRGVCVGRREPDYFFKEQNSKNIMQNF